MCEMISLIPSLLIVQLFRRIRPRKKPLLLSPLRQAMFGQNAATLNPSTSVRVKKKGPITLPWWCLFIAYGLSLIFILISIFFIIVRGIEFGDLKTQQWITSIVTGFFSSILLTQPIKVLFVTFSSIFHFTLHLDSLFRDLLHFVLSKYQRRCRSESVPQWWFNKSRSRRRIPSFPRCQFFIHLSWTLSFSSSCLEWRVVCLSIIIRIIEWKNSLEWKRDRFRSWSTSERDRDVVVDSRIRYLSDVSFVDLHDHLFQSRTK